MGVIEILLLVALTALVIGSVTYWTRPEKPTLTRREKQINEMRAAGMRGRLDATIDLEEQPPRRFIPRIVRTRRR